MPLLLAQNVILQAWVGQTQVLFTFSFFPPLRRPFKTIKRQKRFIAKTRIEIHGEQVSFHGDDTRTKICLKRLPSKECDRRSSRTSLSTAVHGCPLEGISLPRVTTPLRRACLIPGRFICLFSFLLCDPCVRCLLSCDTLSPLERKMGVCCTGSFLSSPSLSPASCFPRRRMSRPMCHSHALAVISQKITTRESK